MHPVRPDRRVHRSDQRGPALDHQLAACRRAAALDAIVVADEDGLVIAAAGGAEVCAELAALGSTAPGSTRVLAIDGARLRVIAAGGTVDRRGQELDRAAAAAHRILAA